MASNNKSFFVNVEDESYCIDENYEVTGDGSEKIVDDSIIEGLF